MLLKLTKEEEKQTRSFVLAAVRCPTFNMNGLKRNEIRKNRQIESINTDFWNLKMRKTKKKIIKKQPIKKIKKITIVSLKLKLIMK